ncbi:unnamed protein product [Orchesella dallaii]|uniref:Uncharacterized protein n=1 Tax=Orchesella dallaii TaxID=48710 RepID=A0ABP1R5W1_9HEXA
MAFANVVDYQTKCEMIVENFPTQLLLSMNHIQEMGSTIIYTTNHKKIDTLDMKWEATLLFVGPRKAIDLTLRFLESPFDELIRRSQYKFSATVVLHGRIFKKMEHDITGTCLEEFQERKVVYQYKLYLDTNKRGPTIGSTIPIEYFGSSGVGNPLKFVLSMTLIMNVDMYRNPSVPLWFFGQEPYNLNLYMHDGWIKTNKEVVVAKCKYIRDRLMEAHIPMALPAGVNLMEASFVGMQHIIPYFFHNRFVTANWRQDMHLIAQALVVLQMESLHCVNILLSN